MRAAFLLPLPLFTACLLKPHGSDEMPHCEDTRTPIAMDEVTPLGNTAQDVLADVPQEEHTALRYEDGTTTDLTVGFAPAGGAFFVESEAVYPEGGVTIDIAVICENRIEVEGMFPFATADGAFSESFASVLVATQESLGITQPLDLDALNGSFDITPFVTAEDYEELSASIYASFADGVSSGTVSGQASGEDECEGDECSSWAEVVEVGAWPASAAE